MNFWSSFRTKLLGMIGLFALALVALIIVTQIAISTVKVEGQLYKQIIGEKDLQSDVVPAALTVRHQFLLLHKVCIEQEIPEARKWLDQFRREELDHNQKCEEWLAKLPDGPIKTCLDREVHGIGKEFFDVARREFIPLAEAGLADPTKMPLAMKNLRTRVREQYLRQMAGSAKLADLTREATKKAESEAREAISYWTNLLIIGSTAILILVGTVGWTTTRGIVNPTKNLITRMDEIACGGGDLTARVPIQSSDEIGLLSGSINAVISNVHDLVVKVRESSLSLFSSATEIAATAREQEATMQTLGSTTNQIAAAVKQISATSSELSGTVAAVTEGGKQTANLATSGRSGLSKMGNTMQRLADSTGSIAAKLGVVREKANDINMVVTTITKVADQTNLLSINAAIEAEKAGEYGRGFLVVAREIRRLADQTAVATLDIENMVRQMQAAVSSGVMEMDKFTEEVRSGVAGVSDIGNQMGQIIEQVQGLNDRFQMVNEGTNQQSAGAKQINEAMLQLASGVQQTSASAKEFFTVTETLKQAADVLREQVSRFKVAG